MDMQIAAVASPGGILREEHYNEIGRYCSQTVRRRFGSWKAAMSLALPAVVERTRPSAAQMAKDVLRVADLFRRYQDRSRHLPYHQRQFRKLSPPFYREHGTYGIDYVRHHLGANELHVTTWKQLKTALGITDV